MPLQTSATIRFLRAICYGAAGASYRKTPGVLHFVCTPNRSLIGLPSAMGKASSWQSRSGPTESCNRQARRDGAIHGHLVRHLAGAVQEPCRTVTIGRGTH